MNECYAKLLEIDNYALNDPDWDRNKVTIAKLLAYELEKQIIEALTKIKKTAPIERIVNLRLELLVTDEPLLKTNSQNSG